MDATYKTDLRDLVEVQALRFDAKLQQGLADLRGDLRAEMHGELANLRTEMHAGFAQLRTEMASGSAALRTEMANLRADLLLWMFLFWLGTVGVTLASVLTS